MIDLWFDCPYCRLYGKHFQVTHRLFGESLDTWLSRSMLVVSLVHDMSSPGCRSPGARLLVPMVYGPDGALTNLGVGYPCSVPGYRPGPEKHSPPRNLLVRSDCYSKVSERNSQKGRA